MEHCLDYYLKEGFPLFGDTVYKVEQSGRHFLSQKLTAFYQSEQGKAFLNKGEKARYLIGISYKFENDRGDMFYIDEREIAFQNNERSREDEYYGDESPYSIYFGYKLIVFKISEYNKLREDLIGKDFYFYSNREKTERNIEDYITKKNINIKLAFGKCFYGAKNDELRWPYYGYDESKEIKGFNNYYRCKDLFIRKGKIVAIFSNDLGEFSALIRKKEDNTYDLLHESEYGFVGRTEITLYHKNIIDHRIQVWIQSEQERKLGQQKADEERIARQKQAEQERIAQQKKHEADILSKYGEKYGNMILQHKVAIGMNKEMCREAGWYPRDTYTTTTNRGVSEIWVINYKTRLYFSDGKLYKIEN